jgi:hypothetical protein
VNQDEPRYWFRAKRYGFGWGLPLTWQGWAFLGGWLVALPVGARLIPRDGFSLCIFFLAMVVLLLAVCWWKGEPAAWRWGTRK